MTSTDSAKIAALWRAMTAADLADVVRIAAAAHPGLEERPDVFAEKLRLYPAGCLALEVGGAVAGYAFSHPWLIGDAPALDAFLGALPPAPDCLTLHDLALAPEARGRGAAAAAIDRLTGLAAAERLPAMTLVAVRGTHTFWARFGFIESSGDRLAAKLAAYGDGARAMTKRLAEPAGRA